MRGCVLRGVCCVLCAVSCELWQGWVEQDHPRGCSSFFQAGISRMGSAIQHGHYHGCPGPLAQISARQKLSEPNPSFRNGGGRNLTLTPWQRSSSVRPGCTHPPS